MQESNFTARSEGITPLKHINKITIGDQAYMDSKIRNSVIKFDIPIDKY